MKLYKALTLAIIVALASSTIDMLFHLITGDEIHLPYITVKDTIIAFTFFIIAYGVGLGGREGVVSSFIAAVMFYTYYRFAEPTLDRTIFKLDEDTWFILIHAGAMILVYLSLWKFVLDKAREKSKIILADKKIWLITVISAAVGIAFLFPSHEFLKNYNLFIGLTLNDHVLIGTLGFTLALISLYKLFLPKGRS